MLEVIALARQQEIREQERQESEVNEGGKKVAADRD
jgi:hypothetical protein